MKRKFSEWPIFCLSAGLLLASCIPPLSNQPGDDAEVEPATLEDAAKTTLMNLPHLMMKLPKSLSLDESATASRALGDTTELTVEMLPALKSQAWYDLQSSDSSIIGFINKAFGYLKKYAKDNPIPAGETFSIPFGDDQLIEMLDMPDDMRGLYTTTVRFNIKGETAEAFKIYGDIVLSGGNSSSGLINLNVKTRFDIVCSGSDSTIEMYIWIDMNQSYSGETYTMTMPMYVTFDSTTGACTMVSSSNDNGVIYSMIEETKVAADGSISNVNASLNDGVLRYLHVAYGDDTAGGIASMNSWTNTYINFDGSTTTRDEDYYWGEYYDQNGELLRRDNGNSRLWVPVGDESYYTNLKNLGYQVAPEVYSTRSYGKYENETWYQYRERRTSEGNWEAYARNYSVSNDDSWEWITQKLDGGVWENYYKWSYSAMNGSYYSWNGSDWIIMNGYPQNDSCSFIYKSDSNPGVWTAGDTVYYWKSGDSYSVGDISYWQTDFYKGYVVPTPENRFGKSYWINYEYPLGQLLPLSPTYAAQYKLIQEEGLTHTNSWVDWNGATQEWSWTNYQYYLNKTSRDLNGDGLMDGEDPIRYDDTFDIRLDDKLSQYDMYYWANGKMSKVKAYFVRTTGALPDYFCTPSTVAIDKVNQKLNDLMNSAYATGIDAYAEKLKAVETAADGVF